jgi:hypothetical protein
LAAEVKHSEGLIGSKKERHTYKDKCCSNHRPGGVELFECGIKGKRHRAPEKRDDDVGQTKEEKPGEWFGLK